MMRSVFRASSDFHCAATRTVNSISHALSGDFFSVELPMQTVITKSPDRPNVRPVSSSASSAPAPKKRRSKGPIFLVILGLVAVFALIFGTKALQIVTMMSAAKSMVQPPTTVTSAKVKRADWAPEPDRCRIDRSGAGRHDQRGASRNGERDRFRIRPPGEKRRAAGEARFLCRTGATACRASGHWNWRRPSMIARGIFPNGT